MTAVPTPRAASALVLAAALLLPSAPLHAQEELKVYISADMEGVVGVVTSDQLGPGGFEYSRFRQLMTDEVNTAIAAARQMGATEILVSDSHGNGENLLIEQLPPDIQLVRSWPRPLMMMEGIDESFDAAILIGYHSSTTNTQGVRAHTISSANLTAVRINGVEMMEASINAAIAGDFGVPVVMISGDDATIEEAQRVIGDMEGAVVKWSYGFHSARTLMPEPARQVIGERVRAALGRLDDFQPYRMEGPVELEISFKNYMPAEIMAYLPIVERVDAHTIRFVGRDMTEVSKFIAFATRYSVSVSP
ncbi:MAG: M55 family metallopeptidase [Longimicrobiales bacterium]|nr:M55 family metallopeptidase [Longimicrobiales bacterium]